jgi:hypothetical protein
MSGFKEDFISSTLVPRLGKHVIGFANTKTTITHKGTVVWRVTDDTGIAHNINIPNSYLVPECGTQLLSPQHWSQEANDNITNRVGTWCAIYNDRVVLQWSQIHFKKTINIDSKRGNVATMWSEGGSAKYKQLCKILKNTTAMYDARVEQQQTTTPSD